MATDFRQLHFILLLLLSCFIVACDSKNSAPVSSDKPIVTIKSLALFPSELTITKLGTEFLLNAVAQDSNFEIINLPLQFVWSSSDESLATVDAQGEVTVHAVGSVDISASYGEFVDSTTLEINSSNTSIQGKVTYQDRPYNMSGFINPFFPVYNNVRYATVELLDINGDVLASTATNANGWFQFENIIPIQYSIRTLTQISAGPAPGFSVKHMDGSIYAVNKPGLANETSYDIKIPSRSPAGGAFNILDVFVSAAEYSREAMKVNVANLSAVWEVDKGFSTYYCTGFDRAICQQGKGVYVLNREGFDTDEFDDDVLLHEFSHFLMDEYYINDSPSSCHYISANDLDLTVAWSEGFATFYASAVKSWMKQRPNKKISSTSAATTYTDTDGNRAFLSYDLTNVRESNQPEESYFYASNEVAVSKILWSILNEYDMEKIREVLANYLNSSLQPTNLPNFWQGMLQSPLYAESQLPGLRAIFAERRVIYQEDEYEFDDNPASAQLIAVGSDDVPDHYLYKDDLSRDVDVFAFDAMLGQRYEINTAELRNGIDTYIRVLDEQSNLLVIDGQVMENDDAVANQYYRTDRDQRCQTERFFNDKLSLASKLVFTANKSGRYYVEVSHNSSNLAKYAAVGPFGTYQLTVNQLQ